LPFGLCNATATFQRVAFNIFSDLVHDYVEVHMDDFTIYGNSYKEALANLKSVLQHCQDMTLSLGNEKSFMLMNEGIVL
jgi:hypothetical protein